MEAAKFHKKSGNALATTVSSPENGHKMMAF